MSDAFWGAFIPGVVIICVALINLWKSHLNSIGIREVKSDVKTVKADVRTVELATNSMKDALILATEKEASARGTKEGIEIGVAQEKERRDS